MKFQVIGVIVCAAMLGACATQQVQTAALDEAAVAEKATEENAETVVGYDVPLHGELIPAAGKSLSREEDDRIVCRRVQVTGSKFHKKVCMTWGEWKEKQQAGREFMRDHNLRARQQGNPQGG